MELSNPFEAFSTVGLGASAVRMALGTTICANVLQGATPAERSKWYLTVDSNVQIANCLRNVEDISFWPLAVAKIYQQVPVNRPGVRSEHNLSSEWIDSDTVFFHLKDNLPQQVSEIDNGKLLQLEQVMVAINYDGQFHWCVCGGPIDFTDPLQIFTEYGGVKGTALTKGLLEQYEAIKANLPPITTDLDPQDYVIAQMREWIIANAVVFNYNFTILAQQG